MTLSRENEEVIKYEVRSTKYEVKELDATELRGRVGRKQGGKHAWGIKQCTCEVDTPPACGAYECRTETGIAAIIRKFLGTDALPLKNVCRKCRLVLGRTMSVWSRFAYGLLLLLGGFCAAQYTLIQSKDYSETGEMLRLLGGESRGYRMDVRFFLSATHELCIVDEGDATPIYGSLDAAMRRNSCVAGVNGGYFAADSKRSPLGLTRHDSLSISPFASGHFTVVGTLFDTGSNIHLVRSKALRTPVRLMREAIQGGPFLVDDFRVVPGLERTRKTMRTFVATDGQGTWCLAITSPLTLHELASILASPNSMGAFRPKYALNLDGGSSCAFWDGEASVSRPSFKSVRNYVGIRPRSRNTSVRH